MSAAVPNPDAAPVVITAHEEANAAIHSLRLVATDIKALGDENLRLEQETGSLREKFDALERAAEENAAASETLVGWTDLLWDLRRGIRDQGEVLTELLGPDTA